MRQLALRAAVNRHWREKRQCLSPAFFFVLEKAVKSVGTAVIPTSLTRWSHGLQHLRRKRPRLLSQVKAGTHSAFGERSHTAAYTPKQGAFRMGALLLPSERFARFGNPAWPGVRTAYFAALGSWPGGALEERRKPSGQRCAYACRCPEGVAAPLGCVIQ